MIGRVDDERRQVLVSATVSATVTLLTAAVATAPVSTTPVPSSLFFVIATAAPLVPSTSSTISSSSTSSTTRPGVGHVDLDPSAIELLFVETLDGVIGLFHSAEGDKAEAARTAGVAIAHHD
jgi:hypothetical protein